jgi:ssDNA-binding replication factor A large subunit
MSTEQTTSNEISVDEQAFEQPHDETGVEGGQVNEEPLRPTVDQETQATVDANHPEGIADTDSERIRGATLAQEERIRAREAELAYIGEQAALSTQDGRAERTRAVVTEQRRQRDAEESDPRELLSQDELAAVNRQAQRIHEELESAPSRAAIARRLAERVHSELDVPEAVFETVKEMYAESGAVCPIEKVPELGVGEVTVQGEIAELWDASNLAIEWVGLLADDSGQTKVTAWRKSRVKDVQEGDTVRLRAAAVNWYRGRWSLALTGTSRVVFPGRDRWWTG